MKALRDVFARITLLIGVAICSPAYAGIPVIDATNLAQQIQQVAAWAVQAQQMVDQLGKLQQEYDSWTGNRNMGSLASTVTRNYLPLTYQDLLTSGVGNWNAIMTAMERYNISNTSLRSTTDTVAGFNSANQQAALNRAGAEMSFDEASQRFTTMQALIDKINVAHDPKDIADLQARIQAEQVMMQNEANKLQALAQLAQAQRDIQQQQARQISLKALEGSPPRFGVGH